MGLKIILSGKLQKMKQLKLTLLAIIGFVAVSFAQDKTSTAVISTPSVQCSMCKSKIEKNLKKIDGISAVKVDYKKKTTTVSWEEGKTNLENIKNSISKSGYEADDVLADSAAYENLADCCKKPD